MGANAAAQEQFGPYLVYERLGVGGMATVHRALERGIEGFERIVALKRLLPHLAADASFIKSFVREAKLASLLNHVNIVQIFELGRVGTAYFISMEYIDGRDIRRILRHARKVSGPPSGRSTVEGKVYTWKAGDLMLSAPGWAVHNHASHDDFVYELTVQDQPLNIAMESLLWQESLKLPMAVLGVEEGVGTNRAAE
jgi:hypothetical protein